MLLVKYMIISKGKMIPPLIKNQQPSVKLIFLILIIITSGLFTLLAGLVLAVPFWGKEVIDSVGASENVLFEDIGFMKYMQVINQLGIFILPVIIFAGLVSENSSDYLKVNRRVNGSTLMLSIVLIIVSQPFLNWLVEFNESINLPESWSYIENWMLEKEDKANTLTEQFLNVNSIDGLLVNVLMIGIIPAFGEELLFRGVILRIFREWWKNIHVAVWVSAFLFSALHIQFYGLIPRMAFGVLFGYIFVWTSNLWIPIVLHFIINVSAVIITYLTNTGAIDMHYKDFGSTQHFLPVIIGFVLMIILMLIIYLRELPKKGSY